MEVDLASLGVDRQGSFEVEWSELEEMLGSPASATTNAFAANGPPEETSPQVRDLKEEEDVLLESGLLGLRKSEPLAPEVAFALLGALRFPSAGNEWLSSRLLARPTASPLTPEVAQSYVVCRRLCDASSALPKGSEIPVSFQSVLNSEVWWSNENEGLASRPMSRISRPSIRGASSNKSSDSEESAKSLHGFRGRIYTLVAKTKQKNKHVSVGDVSIVHTWAAKDEQHRDLSPPPSGKTKIAMPPPNRGLEFAPKPDEAAPPSKKTKRTHQRQQELIVEEEDDDDSFGAEKTLLLKRQRTDEEMTVNQSLRVLGDVRVSGYIFGQLATRPKAADYAEWFEWQPVHLKFDESGDVAEKPPPGTVTQLRSPEQRLSLETSGSGPCLIVSTSPSVAAGLPVAKADADRGALVAFLGQVPVRCKGFVKCGDQLVPSGLDDGTAVALALAEDLEASGTYDALGVAMEDKKSTNDEEETLLCFVRWNVAVRRELKHEIDKVVYEMHGSFLGALVYATALMSAAVFALLATLLIFDVVEAAGSNDAALRRQTLRLENAIFLLGAVSLMLFVALSIIFTTSLRHKEVFVAFWLLFVIISSIRSSKRRVRFELSFVLHFLAFCYHGLLCNTALGLRKHQTLPKSLFADCSPRNMNILKMTVGPFCCILLVFFLVFLT